MLDDLVIEILLLARLYLCAKLGRLEVELRGLQLATEHDVPVKAAANLNIDRLGRVVANLLAEQAVVVPADDAHVGLGDGGVTADFLERVRAVDLHPHMIA